MQILRGKAEMSQSSRFSWYSEIGSNTAVKGVVWSPRWQELEGNTRGDYSTGIALVRAEIAKLKSLPVPKRLIIRLNDVGEAWPAENTFPTYLQYGSPTGIYKANTTDGRAAWRRWNQTIMGYYIDMLKAYANAFDNEPYLEAIIMYRESALQFGSGAPSDFDASAYEAQLRRLALAMKSSWKKTQVIAGVNYLTTSSLTTSHIAYLASIGVGNHSPDACINCGIWADRVMQGVTGGIDYRARVPTMQGVEVSELGLNSVGPDGGYTPKQIGAWANDVQHASYILWDRNTFTGTSEQKWHTGILPYINANPTLQFDDCPTSYGTCDKN